MPESIAPDGVDTALQPDPDQTIPRMQLGSQGFLGLRVLNRQILEEQQRAFRYPQFIKTVETMRNNPTVGAAMNIYRMMISRVNWDVQPPKDATAKDIARAKAIRTMMDDMEGSWSQFIESVIPYLEYGFAINEVVLRRRLNRNGSKFNDGLVGIRKLAPRSQDTIRGWIFSEDGSDLIQVEQTIQYLEHQSMFMNRANERGLIPIDREKILLFTCSGTKGNPEGNSIYKNIFLAFKQLQLLQEQELLGIAKDVQGILRITLPPRYLDPNASPEDKAVVSAFQQIIDGYNAGTQRGLLVPNMIDPESKLPLFTYDLLESKGTAKYDTEAVIKRLQNDIAQALSVDILKLGSDGSGSFSLAEQKSSILSLAIDYRLREIQEVLNHQLLPLLYTMNGWDMSNMSKFVYADVEEIDLADFSAAIQRIFAVSGVEIDRAVLNRVRQALGVPELPDDEPVHVDRLPATVTGQSSRSGDGMKSGAGDGTRKNAVSGSGDSSVANKENAP